MTNGTLHKRNIQLICLPFSGGSGFAFQPLIDHFPKSWEILTLTYPGRGHRIVEPLTHTMEHLLEDSWQQIRKRLRPPYVLFGHSLGSTLAFLLAHKIKEERKTEPSHLILSGTDCPSVHNKKHFRYLFSKKDFKAKLHSYGGISPEILSSDDAFNFFEPIIRADFQVVETWKYQKKMPLNIPATVITGTEENMTLEEIATWQQEFKRLISFKKMKGNHFFLFEQPILFTKLIQREINQSLKYTSNGMKKRF